MRISLVTVVAAALTGCTSPAAPISPAERARDVAELIEQLPKCSALHQRLLPANAPRAISDAVYAEAKRNGCMKRDI